MIEFDLEILKNACSSPYKTTDLNSNLKSSQQDLENLLAASQSQIVSLCTNFSKYSDLDLNLNFLEMKLVDLHINYKKTHKELETNQKHMQMLTETQNILHSLNDIINMLLISDNEYFEARNVMLSFSKIEEFSKYNFYPLLKSMVEFKKNSLLNRCIKNCDQWFSKVLSSSNLEDSNFDLKIVYTAYYIHKMLDSLKIFLSYFNNKRQSLFESMNYTHFIKFLEIESVLQKKSHDFYIKIKNTQFNNKELIHICNIMTKLELDSEIQTKTLEKMCFDHILSEKSKLNIDYLQQFIKNCDDYVENCEIPSVIEFYLATLDTFLTKNFNQIEFSVIKKILHKLKTTSDVQTFELESSYQKFIDSQISQVQKIFRNNEFDKLKDILLDETVIKQIFKEFAARKDDISTEDGLVKFYVFLRTKNIELSDILQPLIHNREQKKSINEIAMLQDFSIDTLKKVNTGCYYSLITFKLF